ncbi:MAG: hypothetical protein R2744_08720 [Bacteroidales bacterium]
MARVTTGETVPKLLEFIENGGTVIAGWKFNSLAYHAGLPVSNHGC